MFFETLNQVTEQTRGKCQGSKFPNDLSHAIGIWCNLLEIPKDITDYILKECSQPNIVDFTNYIYKEGTRKMNNLTTQTPLVHEPTSLPVENQFHQHINEFLNRINIRSDKITFIVLIALAITAIGYFIYQLNQQKQQQTTRREEHEKSNSTPPAPSISTVQTPPISTPPVKMTTKQFLVLVISASQAEFLESLKDKKHIDVSEGEQLYQITRYLWLGSETKLSENS